MPIREYEKCKKCGREGFEMFVRMNEKVYCPVCGEKLKSLISSTSFILKGGGWYNSGYSKEKK